MNNCRKQHAEQWQSIKFVLNPELRGIYYVTRFWHTFYSGSEQDTTKLKKICYMFCIFGWWNC